MEEIETQALRLIKVFEREFIQYDYLNIFGQFQLNYELIKKVGKDTYSTTIVFIITDRQLWKRYLKEKRKIKLMIKNYCAYFGFDFKIVRPFILISGTENVFAIPGKDLENRVVFEHYTSINLSNNSFYDNTLFRY